MKDICIAAILCTLSFAACAAEDTSVPVRPGNPETKDALYLEKARALGDRMTTIQCDDGFIATWWNKSHDFGWMNCNLASADALMELSHVAD